ncbi:nicotinate-nucleotide--dimethylbenzimidazole phosphoribosyltransferase [Mycoplasma sp. P36-A1]|uniref:nicotinate-nucleotide--dimethylbenzimidazole phosphoribosyltransferase n=1 Tax=Mycoplasma sp. P36-A1 TaxID=3252900 RepID=UPI003C30CA01
MIEKIMSGIKELDKKAIEIASIRVDNLAKPLGSLGKLEDISIKLAGITTKTYNSVANKCIIIMSSDNGVVEEGVASAPQAITLEQTKNFIKQKTGVASLSKVNNTKLIVVDVGINSDEIIPGVLNRKISKGTKNIYKEPAMTYNQALTALEIGIEAVKIAKDNNFDIIGVGEMGIGNTTTSAAVLKSLLNCSVEDVVGKGGGITNESFEKKKLVVEQAIKINNLNFNDPIDIVAKVGGYDIVAMAGVYLGAAYYRIPVVIDGYISVVAALVANRINPLVKDYCFASHKSEEIGYNLAIKELELSPMLDLNMRLGEGSGCPIAFSVIEFATSMMNNMATFEDVAIDNEYLDEVRDKECYIV